MGIKIKKYNYTTVNGKLERTELPQSNLKCWFNSVILFFFKLINYKHVYALDHLDKPLVKEILDIKGIRTCRYVDYWGQVYVGQFMWKFGKYYI